MLKIFIGIIFFVSQFSFSEELSDFEKMISGFPECKFSGVYFDAENKTPVHDYFKSNKLKPYKVEDGIAYFYINEKYYGLPVSEIYIPAGYAMVLVVIDVPIAVAEIKLKKILSDGYNISVPAGSESLKVYPSLEKDRSNLEKTILYCDAEPNYMSEIKGE